MIETRANNSAPLVSVLVGAFHGRRHLRRALQSLLRQTYRNLQVIVVNNTADDLSDLVAGWRQSRTTVVQSRHRPGKAAALNRGLQHAEGKYVAYLDDLAVFYPDHVAALVQTLEASADCRVAYSDFYLTRCRTGPDGRQKVLAKLAAISRDFDRLFLCHFNHLLRVSMMHSRDLLAEAGPYDEDIRVLVDWDIIRRMAFFTDFAHVQEITGEIVAPEGNGDARADGDGLGAAEYLKEVLTIRTARPAKPWPKMPDLSIIFVPRRMGESALGSLRDMWTWTFVPYQVYLPLPTDDLVELRSDMPNVVGVPTGLAQPKALRVDQALRCCQGDYVAVVPEGLPIRPMWVEPALHALVHGPRRKAAIALGGEDDPWAVLLRTDELWAARCRHPDLSVGQSLRAENIALRKPAPEERPFQFDRLLARAQLHERDGNWLQAAELYDQMLRAGPNGLRIQQRAANALHRAGRHDEQALRLCLQVNARRPTPESLLLEARIHRRADRIRAAADRLERARKILTWKGQPC